LQKYTKGIKFGENIKKIMEKIFVTGATGTIGKEVVNALLKKGVKVVAANRSQEKAKGLFGDKVEWVNFDFEDPNTYKTADDAAAVFLLGPPLNLRLSEMLMPFVDYLSVKGPSKVVYLSANGMEKMKELPFHAQMEAKLKSTTLEWTILRPGFFMQNFGNYEMENIEERKIIFSPAGEGKTAFISAVDIGQAAAEVLINEGHEEKTYTLLGDRLLSYYEIAALLSEIIGEKIIYPNPDENTYRSVLKESGAPDFIADYMIPVYNLIRFGKVENVSNDLQNLIGRKPEELKDVLKRDFGS